MATKKEFDYRKLNEELDSILHVLQSGEVDVEVAITKYERGMAIVEELKKYLSTAKNQISRAK